MTSGNLRVDLPGEETVQIGGKADGVQAALRIRREGFFRKCLIGGDVGFGESYVDGDWETEDLTAVISFFIANVTTAPSMSGSHAYSFKVNLLRSINRLIHRNRANSQANSRRNIHEHYDLGNEFYRLWLDESMTYSSGLYERPEMSLPEAQEAKYAALCRKLQLSATDHLLEIGTGWGGFARHAAANHGCRVTTVTISTEQFEFARHRIAEAGVENLVDVRFQDYREIRGSYDKIASIEMLEAVGDKYYGSFFRQCHQLLKPDGLLGLQFINCPDSRFQDLKSDVDWIQKHIFPGSLLPSIGRINEAINRTGDLSLHHLEDFGLSYARTLKEWRRRFNLKLDEVRAIGFDDRFIRKWNYYLTYCEAAFAMRNIGVVHAIYSRPNNHSLTR